MRFALDLNVQVDPVGDLRQLSKNKVGACACADHEG